ncbi:TIGR03085 family metal-binding protein [Longispora sp. NPDC051575]|uniref:TIGR03085 family metal-binding protein n=1 Tax=Longispora sp. NPDC051575 TaxID=3154943 RepID=UPI00343B290B
MTSYALRERHLLADLLLEVGPDAPTLCGDWVTADLAAHLVLRERRPDAGLGVWIPAFAGWTDKVAASLRDRKTYPEIVELVRHRPWWIAPLDETINLIEYLVHHEDVRRATSGFEPRDLTEGFEHAVWGRLRALRLLLGNESVRLVAPGVGERTAGTSPTVTVTGPPSELALFCFGRQRVAQVAYDGPEESVRALRVAKLGL